MKAQTGLLLVLVALIIGVVYILNQQGELNFSGISGIAAFSEKSIISSLKYPKEINKTDEFKINLTLDNKFDFPMAVYSWLESGSLFSYNNKQLSKSTTSFYYVLNSGDNKTIVWKIKTGSVEDEVDANIFLNIQYSPLKGKNYYGFSLTAINNNSMEYYSTDKLGVSFESKKAPLHLEVSTSLPNDFIYKPGVNDVAEFYILASNNGNGEFVRENGRDVILTISGSDISRIDCNNGKRLGSTIVIPINITTQKTIVCNYTMKGISDIKISKFRISTEYKYKETKTLSIHVYPYSSNEKTNNDNFLNDRYHPQPI